MRRILSHSPIGIALIDYDGNYIEFNPAYSALYDYDPAELQGQPFTVVFSPDQRERILQLHQNFLSGGGELRGEWDVVRHDGTALTIISESVRVNSEAGEPQRLVYVLDITSRKKAEYALERSESRLATIIESAMDAVICLDAQHRISVFNAAAEAMFGYSAKSMLGQSLDVLVPEELRAAHPRHIESFAATGRTSRRMGQLGQLQACRASGERFPIEASISHAQNRDESIYTVILRDVTEQVRTKAELEVAVERLGRANLQLLELAQIDQLTKLPNRRALLERMTFALVQNRRRGTNCCVAFIDLDGFKAVNDEHGHDAGDALLVEIASRLKGQIREVDTVARFGGDEFVALLSEVQSLESCAPTIDRLRALVALPVMYKGASLQVTASIGTALSSPDSTVDELLKRADLAMYQLKQKRGSDGPK